MKKINIGKLLQERKILQKNNTILDTERANTERANTEIATTETVNTEIITNYYKYNNDIQINLINKLYLDLSFNEKKYMLKELKAKHNSYKSQDREKDIFDETTFITVENIIEKLLISKLKCIYCKNKLLVLYSNAREPYQWTLDRVNNNLDHSNENTVISCFKCNIQRRRTNIDKFKFTKQLNLVKKI